MNLHLLTIRRSWATQLIGTIGCLLVLSGSILIPSGLVLAEKKEKIRKKKNALPSASASASAKEQSLTNIPLPIGHEAKGLVLPDFNSEGRLVGKFEAGTARRTDQEHVTFQDLKITTFTPENQVDLRVDMHTSVFNLNTRLLVSKERTTIRRADFNVAGDSAQFDTDKRTSHLVGNVKMVISGQSNLIKRTDQP
jgi:hypothetical protein